MKWLYLPLICAAVLRAGDSELPDLNVNSQYTVDDVQVGYLRHPKRKPALSPDLRSNLDQVVGQKLDHGRLEGLAKLIQKELRVPDVNLKVAKGATPDHVTVKFEVHDRQETFDMDVPQFAYHSRQGWTGEGKLTIRAQGNSFHFGLVSDNDSLAERFAGIRAGFERKNMGNDRLQLRFNFASYHEQWNRATEPALYRDRTSFSPEATLVLANPLQLSFGVDFTRLGKAASNAATAALRYHQNWGASQDSVNQTLEASYGIRASTGVLESDYHFTRHLAEAGYKYRRGKSRVDLNFVAGHVSGITPIYERFVLGNTRTLRGWNKYDLNPNGAANAIHGSLEYSFAGCMAFYDTGAAWDRVTLREQKQSLGLGFRTKDGFQLAVAFPMKAGSVDPIFYAGIGF